jgi:hypothetical protein
VMQEVEAVLFCVVVGHRILALSVGVVATAIFVPVAVDGTCQRCAVRAVYRGSESGVVIAGFGLMRSKPSSAKFDHKD